MGKDKFSGLTKEQKNWAKKQVKYFKLLGVAIPYGIIKSEAKKVKPKGIGYSFNEGWDLCDMS